MSEKNKNILFYVLIIVVFAVAAFISFYKLNLEPIKLYDETRHGISAYEMIKNNNYIINTYNYEADYWNLKPPLSFWFIAAGYKLFGYNELGLKFFSAVFFMLTIAIVMFYTLKRFGRKVCICACCFILSMRNIISPHMMRYADADMLFILCVCSAFVFLMMSSSKKYLFCLSGLMFSMAFLAKSYHSAVIPICTALYLLLTKEYRKYKLKDYVLYIACAAVPILLWGFARYRYDGIEFFKKMIFVDVLNRSAEKEENSDILYYTRVVVRQLTWHILITAIAVIITIKKKTSLKTYNFVRSNHHDHHINTFRVFRDCLKKKLIWNNDCIGMMIWTVVPVIIFSLVISTSVWFWYIYPQLFIGCILLAVYFVPIFDNKILLKLFGVLLLCFPLHWTIYTILDVHHTPRETIKEHEFLKKNIYRNDDFMNVHFYIELGDRADYYNKLISDVLFVAELYGDMIYTKGGAEGFAETDGNAYLMITAEEYDKYNLAAYKVAAYDDDFYLLNK